MVSALNDCLIWSPLDLLDDKANIVYSCTHIAMRYYIKCKLNPDGRKRLVDSIKSGNLAKGKIFYEGMQAALR